MALFVQGTIDFISSVCLTVFAMKLTYDFPDMLILSLPYCQTLIPMILFVVVQRPKQVMPAEEDENGTPMPQVYEKTVYFILRIAALICLLGSFIPIAYFVYVRYASIGELHWFAIFIVFLVMSSGTHWLNYGQFSFNWTERFVPKAKKSCNEVFGMGVILSLGKLLIETFYNISYKEYSGPLREQDAFSIYVKVVVGSGTITFAPQIKFHIFWQYILFKFLTGSSRKRWLMGYTN